MGSLGFWGRAQESPDWIAVIEADGTEHRAGDLLGRVNQIVHGLRALGLQPGDGIASLLPNGVAPLELYLAALQAGWYLTPVNWHFTAPEIAYILRDCEAKALFVRRAVRRRSARPPPTRRGSRPAPGSATATCPGSPRRRCCARASRRRMPDGRTAGATMHYTSGTTGRPKGVRRPLSGLDPDDAAELGTALLQFFGITAGPPNVHLITSPNYHTAVTVFGGSALHMGHTLVTMDSWDAEQALALVERYRVTNTHMVPTQFKRMLSLPERGPRRLRPLVHAVADPRGGAVPGPDQAGDAGLVGTVRLRVLRGHRGRRHDRHPGRTGWPGRARSAPRGRSARS